MARKWKVENYEMVDRPHQWVKEQMVCYHVASKSFTSTLLDVPSLSEEDEHRIKWTAAAMYGGTFLLSFPLPATHHPTSQGGADTVRMSSSVVGAVYPHHLDSFGHSRILLGHDPFPRSTEKSTSRN